MKSKLGQSVVPSSMLLRSVAAAVAFVVVNGCSDATGPGTIASITTPTSSIALQKTPQSDVLNTTLTLTNTSPYALAWSSCGVSLEKAGLPALPPGKSDWTSVWSRACFILEAAASITDPSIPINLEAVLQPGQSVSIGIVAPVGQAPYQQFDGQPGAYRFYVPLAMRVLGTYHAVSHDLSVSETFTLLPAP